MLKRINRLVERGFVDALCELSKADSEGAKEQVARVSGMQLARAYCAGRTQGGAGQEPAMLSYGLGTAVV